MYRDHPSLFVGWFTYSFIMVIVIFSRSKMHQHIRGIVHYALY